ncbi:radical SAM protein [candidate division WOR-3 bacterium]|nr:radical SAM protein [candidate division WOR-3 bacterium]
MYSYQIDPYIGCEHHCYYCYVLNQPEIKEGEILIHKDLMEQLSKALSKLESQTIYMGMNTDPYQPSEEIYKQTRQVLEILLNRGFSVCILTKSDLVVRDIDILSNMVDSSAGISIAFQDEHTRQLFETKAPSNERRIEALKKLKEAGIQTYTLVCPVMPFITDVESLIDMVEPYSDTIWLYALNMKEKEDKNWQNIREILDSNYPEMTEQYRKIAFSKEHPYWKELREKLNKLKLKRGLNLRVEL